MLPSYADIRALTDQAPIWFDERGVPRYAPFHPSLLGVYDRYAVLAEIECQSCGERLLVGVGRPEHLFCRTNGKTEIVVQSLDWLAKDFVFGDPPRHDCPGAGESMSCIERRIVEAWERVGLTWGRLSEYEIALD